MWKGVVAAMIGLAWIAPCQGLETDQHTAAYLPYSPLAGLQISINSDQEVALIGLIRKFAKDEHLGLEEGPIPAQGRTITNITIRLSSETFFHIANVFDELTFELIAYSHESSASWRPTWDRLKSRLAADLKPGQITVETFPH